MSQTLWTLPKLIYVYSDRGSYVYCMIFFTPEVNSANISELAAQGIVHIDGCEEGDRDVEHP